MLALAASSVIALGQVPKDVNGWSKIRWDMTVAQAKALYGAQARESDGGGNSTKYTEKLVIDNFAVGDIKMKVSIETLPNSNLIKEVTFSLADESQSRGAAYTDIKNLLTQRYGRPREDKDREGGAEDNSATWTFPSTVITLFWVETKRLDFGVLSLQYTATDKKVLGVL
jgi:hypothetical protein